jgi:hypothetical protein
MALFYFQFGRHCNAAAAAKAPPLQKNNRLSHMQWPLQKNLLTLFHLIMAKFQGFPREKLKS